MSRDGPKTQKTTAWPGNDITDPRAHPKGTDEVEYEHTHTRAGASTGRRQGDEFGLGQN